MVRPSILALLKSKPPFQRKFCSDENFSTKRNQEMFCKGSREIAWIYLSFETNRLKKYWELQKWCAPQFWPFWNPSHFFSASFVQMKISLRRGIRKCSSKALWKVLGYSFHLKQTAWKNIENSGKWCAPQFWPFWNPSHFLSASFVQIRISLRRGISNCSFKALWNVLWYTFHFKQTAWKSIDSSRKGAPLNFGPFEIRATFSAQVLFRWNFPYEEESENVL